MPGLLGSRDPAQPLLTLHDGPARVELSGGTVGNWVAKTANLLVDGYGSPDRVGLLLGLHWQPVCLLLGAAATGATVVVAATPSQLAGCRLAFTAPETAVAALDAGVEEVFAVSGHPMGAALGAVPAGALDAALEIPAYGDRFVGPAVEVVRFEVDGRPLVAGAAAGPAPALTGSDRVLTCQGLVDGLDVLLAALGAGASLVLVPTPRTVDLDRVADSERVTATAGLDLPGLPRIG